jgi:hypothetical protein
MKRLVFTFWRAPSEEDEFIAFLESTGKIVGYTCDWKKSPSEVQSTDLRSLLAISNPSQLMIGPDALYTKIEDHRFDQGVLYNIKAERSAVIHYRRGSLRSGKLSQTNLAAYVAVEERPEEAGRVFDAWCKKVFTWVRRETPEKDDSGNYRITVKTKTGVVDGSWRLSF